PANTILIGSSSPDGPSALGRYGGGRHGRRPGGVRGGDAAKGAPPGSGGVPARLGQLLAHHLALERREVVHEQLAFQVVHLVLDSGGQPSHGCHLLLPDLTVVVTHDDVI